MNITEQVAVGKMVLTLTGRMDFQSRHSFHQAIERAKCSKLQQIILNLSNVPFIDSAGLGLLMLAHKTLGEANIRLSLEMPDGYVREVLILTNIGQKFPITVIQSEMAPKAAAPPHTPVVPLVHVPLKPSLVFESANMQERLLPILEKLEQKNLDLRLFLKSPVGDSRS